MFATIELAARIEAAEARLSRALGEAVVTSRPDVQPFVEDVDGGVAVYTGPSSPMNKMIGIGFGGIPQADRLRQVEELFSARNAPLQAEVSTLADPAVAAQLTRRSYVLQGFENVLGRALIADDGAAPVDETITIALMNESETERWLDAAVTSFMHLDAEGVQPQPLPPREELEGPLRDLTRVSGFLRYCAWIKAQLAGVASLRIDNGVAQLCGAGTLPQFRRRGVQRRFLQHRLAEARAAGCDVAVMTTQPGSKSQENGHRQGFTLLYSRAILIKEPRAAK
jgi:ribosomal protein S18 acetylase RimI-like enzyme